MIVPLVQTNSCYMLAKLRTNQKMVELQQKRCKVISKKNHRPGILVEHNKAKPLVLNPEQGSGLPEHSPIVRVAVTRLPEGLELTAGA